MKTFHASSCDSLLPPDWQGTVVGVYDRAANLVSGQGQFLFIVSRPLGDGPHRIRARGETLSEIPLESGQTVRFCKTVLQAEDGSWSVSLAGARTWTGGMPDRKLPPPAQASELVVHLPSAEVLTFRRTSLVDQEFLRRTLTFVSALVSGHLPTIFRATGQLVGLGSGLTPSGDDYLRGVLCGLSCLPAPTWLPELHRAVRENLGRTTALSAAFLAFSLDDRFSQLELDLMVALAAGNHDALLAATAAVLTVGAFSGEDFLLGVHDALANADL
jgi:hypothetical protein